MEEVLCLIDVTDDATEETRSVYVTTMVDDFDLDVDDPREATMFFGFCVAANGVTWVRWSESHGIEWVKKVVH